MEQQVLAQGTILGGRFEILGAAGRGDLSPVYKAADKASGRAVALHVIPRQMFPDEAWRNTFRERVNSVSHLVHKNIREAYGIGDTTDGSLFLASEWIEGQNLRALLDARKQAGKRFSFKGAYNIIGHICNALTSAHQVTFHGTLSPRSISVSSAGRVKVGDFGLSILRWALDSYPGRNKVESTYWAPEVLAREANIGPRADIYSLGALFYELITGFAPQRPLKKPSALGFAKDIDNIIARSMAAAPSQRFSDAESMKIAIRSLVQAQEVGIVDDTGVIRTEIAGQSEIDDALGFDIEIDVAAPIQAAAPAPAPAAPQRMVAPAAPPVGYPAKPTGSMLNAPGLPPPPRPTELEGDAPRQSSASLIDMGALLSGLGKSESARWMVQKDKFDHGPFTDRELVQMIMLGEVEGKHSLLNMETGERKKVRSWGHFEEYLEKYRLKKKEQEEREALVRTEKAETRGNVAKFTIAAAIVGAIAFGVVLFIAGRKFVERRSNAPDNVVAALDSGDIKLKTGGNLINKRAGKGKGKRRAGKPGEGGGEFVPGMSYDDAMNMGVDLGSVANSAGQTQLTPEAITNIMDRNVRKFLPCIAGQSVKRVNMNIAIGGDGRIVGVSVEQGDSALKRCVESKVRSIKFPQSSAPRTAASWYFEIY